MSIASRSGADSPSETPIPTLDDVRAAAELLSGRVRTTELLTVDSPSLAERGIELELKLECTQHSGSFKYRGASHFIARLTAGGDARRGVITYSSGNHGRAVSEAARDAGLDAVVTVPDHIDPSKRRNIEAAGAEVVDAGPTSESRRLRALEIAEARGLTVIPPFDHPWIVAGQGTAALEVLDARPDTVAIWVPVGGGGLASGTQVVGAARDVPVHTVEPVGAAALHHALAAGEPVTLAGTESVADGLLPVRVGALPFAVLRSLGATSHVVEEPSILANLRRLHGLGVHAEPSGAVSSTPLLEDGIEARPGRHVAIVSGSNVDENRLARLLAG